MYIIKLIRCLKILNDSSSLKKFIYIDYQYIMQKTIKFAQTKRTV